LGKLVQLSCEALEGDFDNPASNVEHPIMQLQSLCGRVTMSTHTCQTVHQTYLHKASIQTCPITTNYDGTTQLLAMDGLCKNLAYSVGFGHCNNSNDNTNNNNNNKHISIPPQGCKFRGRVIQLRFYIPCNTK